MPSKVVASYTYDTAARVLRVVFVSGLIYEYKDVPPEVYEAMKMYREKGVFLNKEVKGKYGFERVPIQDVAPPPNDSKPTGAG